MRGGLNLTSQILILVTVPLLVQLALLAFVAHLQNQAEMEAKEALAASRLSKAFSQLERDIYAFGAQNLGEKALPLMDASNNFEDQMLKVLQDYRDLEKHLGDKKDQLEIIEESKRNIFRAADIVRECLKSYRRAGDKERPYRKSLYLKLRQYAALVSNDDMVNLGRHIEQFLERSPEKQAQFRNEARTVILYGGAANVLFAAFIAMFLIKNVTRKLEIMNENAFLLAAEKPLNEPFSGNDEISNLDRSFHQLSRSLKQALARERAVVENARDIICSLDASGKIVSINQAIEDVLHVSAEEVTGMYIIELIVPEDITRATEFLEKLTKGGADGQIELRLKRKVQLLEVLLSARWVADEGAIVCVIHDITQRKRAEALRNEIITMITHDLRTPICTIQNYLEMMNEGFLGSLNEKGEKMTGTANRNCERVLELINDFLDAERIRSGKMPLNAKTVSLARIAQSACGSLSDWALEHGVKIQDQVVDCQLEADEQKLVRVLTNLIANAVKFSPEGTKVEVSSQVNGEFVELSVRDYGPGMSAQVLAKIFDRFEQAEGNTDGGSGLGLYICKSFVDLHGGSIRATSKEKEGSTFTVCLPKALGENRAYDIDS